MSHQRPTDPNPVADSAPTADTDTSWLKNTSYLGKYNLSNRIAVVTGGGSGIGLACAAALGSVGAHVVITGRNEDRLIDAVTGLQKEHHVSAEHYVFDVSDPAAVRAAAQAIGKKHGAVHVLVNNAGVAQPSSSVHDISDDLFDSVLKTNLYGAHWVMQAFLPFMDRTHTRCGASIINIGSMAGTIVNTPIMISSYNASKAGLQHLSASYAVELAEHGIRVNTVAPGFIRTDMTTYLQNNPPLAKSCLARVPMKRMGDPEEIAQTVLHLATEASSYVTGMTWIVDGGYCVP